MKFIKFLREMGNMDLFVMAAVAILSAMSGFWVGRSLQWQVEETEKIHGRSILQGRAIVSPAQGQVTVAEENGRRIQRITPEQGKIYAPASGRISRLYPMGSAMLLQTEFGADVLIRAGEGVDDMCSDFYRCRVMEHEYVRKGALILEYDPEGIRARGANPEVLVSVENEDEVGKVTMSEESRMKAGDPLLYISCADGKAANPTYGEIMDRDRKVGLFW